MNQQYQTQGTTSSKSSGNLTGWLKTTEGLITSIIAILVIIPSMINALVDVYTTILDIPSSLPERNNQRLFKAHFEESPAHTGVGTIRTERGDLNVKLNVYESGDIYIEYGKFSQWFPFDPESVAPDANEPLGWLMHSAYAEVSTALSPCETAQNMADPSNNNSPLSMHRYIQQEQQIKAGQLQRIRIYDDGCKETLFVEVNSGKILDQQFITIELTDKLKSSLEGEKSVQMFAPEIIDVRPSGKN